MGHRRCRKKWCPCCAPAIARKKSLKLQAAVSRFRWPLFITLTVKNCDDLNKAEMRKLRRGFGKLRHRKFWREKVKGGVAGFEVTNIGNGWHPHLHAVLDCRWLAHGVIEPRPFWSREEKKKQFQLAADSVQKVWSRIMGHESTSIKIKRADPVGILKEVVKYSIKGSDLATCEGPISQLIDAIDGTRMLTTFGSVFGLSQAEVDENNKKAHNPPLEIPDSEKAPFTCCSSPALVPLEVWQAAANRDSRQRR